MWLFSLPISYLAFSFLDTIFFFEVDSNRFRLTFDKMYLFNLSRRLYLQCFSFPFFFFVSFFFLRFAKFDTIWSFAHHNKKVGDILIILQIGKFYISEADYYYVVGLSRCVKSVGIRSFVVLIFPHLDWTWENMDQKNS